MRASKPKLVAVAGTDFDRSYTGTLHLLESLGAAFAVEAYVFTDVGRGAWYARLPFACRVFPFRGSVWDGGRLQLASKLFRIFVGLRMLFARHVLITETAYLREAVLAKKIKGRRLVLAQFCQELALPEEYPRDRWPRTQQRWARVPDVVIDVDPLRAAVRAEYYGLRQPPYVLRNTLARSQLPPPAPAGGLWALAGIPPPPPGLPVLVHAGGIAREKPFERIIDAVAALPEPVFLLAFCSASAAEVRRLRDYAAGKLRPERFHFHSAVSREALRASYWEADVGVVDYAFSVEPTLNQKYCAPTKLYEFMACGLAVLGSDNDSLRDIVEREGVGLCARGDAPADLARALGDLLRQDVAAIKARARTVFAERYSYETACADEVRRIAAELRRLGRRGAEAEA
ncbi:MAG: glycosyltransferase [Kiritimatiellia bacterium]